MDKFEAKHQAKHQANFDEMPNGWYWYQPIHIHAVTKQSVPDIPELVSVDEYLWRRKVDRWVRGFHGHYGALTDYKPDQFFGPITPPSEWLSK